MTSEGEKATGVRVRIVDIEWGIHSKETTVSVVNTSTVFGAKIVVGDDCAIVAADADDTVAVAAADIAAVE